MERSKQGKIKNVTHTKERHIFESIFFTLINISEKIYIRVKKIDSKICCSLV